MSVNGGVPVQAPEEHRRELMGRPRVIGRFQHVRNLVGVLPVDAGEGEAGEALGKEALELFGTLAERMEVVGRVPSTSSVASAANSTAAPAEQVASAVISAGGLTAGGVVSGTW